MNIRKKTQQDMGLQPYTIAISKENYNTLEKLRMEGNFPSRNDLITALIKGAEK